MKLRKTITVVPVLLKMQKAPEKTGAVKQKKTETPIFQGISAVLPKLYLGGRSEEARTPDILTSCHLRCPKLFARYSLRTILTATPTNAPFIVHRTRSRVLPKAGKRLFVFRKSRVKTYSMQK